MKKRHYWMIALIFCSVALISCTREGDNPDNPTPAQTHVYVAGSTSSMSNTGAGPAVCWEDGVFSVLDADAFYAARAVCVKGNDVYYGGGDADQHPVIWKNGVPQVLSNEEGCVYALATANNKIYAAGYVDHYPVYWVDGQMFRLSNEGNIGGTATAICIVGNDMYITSTDWNDRGAYLWKNGTIQRLSDKASAACDVCVYNNNVYVVGSESYTSGGYQKSVMWVNGNIRDIQVTTNNGFQSKATAVAILNGSPYVVLDGWVGDAYNGRYQGFAWYNEQVTSLSNCNRPKDVFIHNNDVYIAGLDDHTSTTPVLLKNLQKVQLNTPSPVRGICYAVFVK